MHWGVLGSARIVFLLVVTITGWGPKLRQKPEGRNATVPPPQYRLNRMNANAEMPGHMFQVSGFHHCFLRRCLLFNQFVDELTRYLRPSGSHLRQAACTCKKGLVASLAFNDAFGGGWVGCWQSSTVRFLQQKSSTTQEHIDLLCFVPQPPTKTLGLGWDVVNYARQICGFAEWWSCSDAGLIRER